MTVATPFEPLAALRASLPAPVELRETHASWVLLSGDLALKIKKPVTLPFLDFGTLEHRRRACRDEVALNVALAPDVYRGVVAVVADGDAARLSAEDDPAALEYAVEMRRYDEGATFAARLSRGELDPVQVDRLGAKLARFHALTPIVPVTAGAEPVQRWLDDTLASLGSLAHGSGERRLVARAGRFAAACLAARRDELDERARLGRVRDGHGDLRLEHVVLEGDRLSIVDCIEFDDALRRIDVASDLAFLVMDLHAAARPDLAERLVAAYRAAGGDPGDDELLAWLAAYRAQVRAKVSYVRAGQQRGQDAARSRRDASALLVLADRLLWRARGSLTIAVGGLAASGKTTLATALADRTGRSLLSSDHVRKADAGLGPTERGGPELYTPAVSRHVYTELGALAAAAPLGAIVDATFRAAADRAAFLGAHGHDRPLLLVECEVPQRVRVARARARENDAAAVSDAGADVARAQAMDPLDELAPHQRVVVRGDAPVEDQVDVVADAIDRRLLS